MKNTKDEMNLAEIFGDPLILAVMRADGVALNEFKELMYSAARSLKMRDGTALTGKFRTPSLAASSKRTLVATMQPLFVGSFEPCCANM
ncbi:hypothetical protein [Agrobacterium rosae]|uniref:Uncharacterized protein n=1 Tax=Agrobacterium rosae TaxID=1972867 RepID=A0A1R3U8A0_9HYPH|nr:hypothetical protein [Agrobacterium rosae]MBN7806521.1 hypothetical protein [Agrobacterium rosae]MBN7806536.1 hypothetical protein [Agrobacterium rosae]MCM2436299.1 hypothetical protein [Agrobacterium rosae]MDX8315536.1 hypothetical protein [Agrobacterium rosae]MDX8332974.1 hypothetical protein [Agrobacterium rosae]